MKSNDTPQALKIYPRLLSKFLQLFFGLLYNQFAWVYDFVAWVVSLGRWNSWVMTAAEYLGSGQGRILELGHGTGHLQLALLQAEKNVVGIDQSKQMGKMASSRILKAGQHASLTCGQAQILPFSSRTFSAVISTFPTEYITEPRTLSEISRVLSDDGIFVFLPVAFITGKSLFDRAAAWLFRVTGQAPDLEISVYERELLPRFAHSGFHLEVITHRLKASAVIIVIAKKTAAKEPYRNP